MFKDDYEFWAHRLVVHFGVDIDQLDMIAKLLG